MLRVLKPLGSAITTLPVGPEHPGLDGRTELRALLRDRLPDPAPEAAWALLEERLRDAVAFCRRLQGDAGEPLATTLGPIGDALGEIADTLAAHFGEWGAVSRFGRPEERPPASARPSGGRQGRPARRGRADQLRQQIKPLFRSRDQQSMKFAFDLWSYDDVKANAQAILERLDNGTMPCDGAWPLNRSRPSNAGCSRECHPDTERTAQNRNASEPTKPCRSHSSARSLGSRIWDPQGLVLTRGTSSA